MPNITNNLYWHKYCYIKYYAKSLLKKALEIHDCGTIKSGAVFGA